MTASRIGTLSVVAGLAFAPAAAGASGIVTYSGMCEPSGAVALPEGSFGDKFVVADDEDNVLRAYRADVGGAPVSEFDLDAVLKPTPERAADIEAATWLGGRAYWIGSHSRRNSDGRLRKDRWQFFSTTLSAGDDIVDIALQPLESLNSLLDGISSLDPRLRDAIRSEERDVASLAPDNGGFNIEGMTVAGDGTGIVIGLRSPLFSRTQDPDTPAHALVIPFVNPVEALDGATPMLGPPIPVRLDGRGIRSMEYSPLRDVYLLIAGPVGGDEPFALYRWSGQAGEDPVLLEAATAAFAELENFTPEAMIIAPEGDKVLVLSDDGDICPSPPSFRGAVIAVD